MPSTEKRGRRHSSVVTVVALPSDDGLEPPELDMADVRVDVYRDSGPGGQHRNKTDSAVRMTHAPTGIVVTATESRSQWMNRQEAARRLARELARRSASETENRANAQRSAAFGKPRSWTWVGWRDRVTAPDGRTAPMSRALSGRLDPVL